MRNPNQLTKLILLLLFTLVVIAGCSGGSGTSHGTSTTDTTNGTGGGTEDGGTDGDSAGMSALSTSLLSHIQSSLSNSLSSRQGRTSNALSQGEVATIIEAARNKLSASGLGSSKDLATVLPLILEGANRGIGQLNLAFSDLSPIVQTLGKASVTALPAHSEWMGGTSVNAVVGASSKSLMSSLGDTNTFRSDIGLLSSNTLAGMIGTFDNASFSEEESDASLESLISQGLTGLAEVSSFSLGAGDFKSAVTSISTEATASLGTLPGHSSTKVVERLRGVTDAVSSGLSASSAGRTAARVSLSEEDLLEVAGSVTKKTISALGRIDNLSPDALGSCIGGISKGMVSNLEKLGARDAQKLKSFSQAVIANAVDALDEIVSDNGTALVDEAILEESVGEISAGVTEGFGEISGVEISAADLPDLVQSVTETTAKNLDNLSLLSADASRLPNLLNQISSSTVGALVGLKSLGAETNNADFLGDIVSKVVEGATRALSEMNIAKVEGHGFDMGKALSQLTTGVNRGMQKAPEGVDLNSIQAVIKDKVKEKALEKLSVDNATLQGMDSIDLTPPSVHWLIPNEDNSSNFFVRGLEPWTEQPITIQFSKLIEHNSLKRKPIVIQDSYGWKYSGQVEAFDNVDNTTTVVLKFPDGVKLRYEEQYTIIVLPIVVDLSGNTLLESEMRSFITEALLDFQAGLNYPPHVEEFYVCRYSDNGSCTGGSCLVAQAQIKDIEPWEGIARRWSFVGRDNVTTPLDERFEIALKDTLDGDLVTVGQSATLFADYSPYLPGELRLEVLDNLSLEGFSSFPTDLEPEKIPSCDISPDYNFYH